MKKTLSERIKLHREKLSLSQIKASIEIGISYALLTQIEQGKEAVSDISRKKIEQWLGKEGGK